VATTLDKTAGHADHETGLVALFRSKSIFAILRYLTERHLDRVRVSVLEQELHRQAAISRGAVANALDTLSRAGLLTLTKTDGALVCQTTAPRLWAKLADLFTADDQPSAPTAGMPWLAEVVTGQPRRQGFPRQPLAPEPITPLTSVETMLAKLPPAEPAAPGRRSAAPGRRR
jgi:hypothetical protein